MSTRMLIDARHPEETRVAVVKGNRVEEFDYESVTKRYLKGNIYLAKVTRVEPSLQACFVDYGENRHGFLAFSEIHPDYYQIPSEDRDALLAEEAAGRADSRTDTPLESSSDDTEHDAENADDTDGDDDNNDVEQISGEDDYDSISHRKTGNLRRRYKIQEVIKRRQILLVQVVKEERGSKGAALTTYMSLAGRYCVLMPNSQNGGGISRKISNAADRKKLKDVMSALEVPEGMGCIIRTAGLNRTKTEIKRDFDYLLRLWDGIRERTLSSVAPALIHEEADLIKRSIRDLYSRDIDEIHVEGEEGYRTAKDFMKLLMPSHARRVQHYKDRIPLFYRYQVETQLEAMYSPTVQLKSGGYLVINPTEALIAIDVNSGRSTKEHNIEETALKTNLESADEVARQLRLRDLAGLIVIDFIDMEDRGNNRAVEKRLKDALKTDRARIQVGRISSFGLMEMSRQRLRPNLLEASRLPCPTCSGAGIVPSTESAALNILRALEEEGIRDRSQTVTVRSPSHVAFYLLNQKRDMILELEQRYGFGVTIDADAGLGSTPWEMDRVAKSADRQQADATAGDAAAASAAAAPAAKAEKDIVETADSDDDGARDDMRDEQASKKRRRRRRRGRRGRGGDDSQKTDEQAAPDTKNQAPQDAVADTSQDEETVAAGPEAGSRKTDEKSAGDDRPRRRSRRRRRPAHGEDGAVDKDIQGTVQTADETIGEATGEATGEAETAHASTMGQETEAGPDQAEAVKPRKRRRVRRKADSTATAAQDADEKAAGDEKAVSDDHEAMPASFVEDTAPDIADRQKAATKSDDSLEAPAGKKATPRKRRPRKTAETKGAATDEAVKSDKRRPRSRAKTSQPEQGTPIKQQPDQPAANMEPVSAPDMAVTPMPATLATPATEPHVERHVIGPELVASTKSADRNDEQASREEDKNAPRKKGWWQRALGKR